MNRLLIFGTCSAAVGALVIGISVLSDPVFKLEIDPAVQNHFSNDKEAWWKELPFEVLPTRSGVYNHESWENEKEALGLLVLGRSILGDLPIVEVSHSKKGMVEISLSKEPVACGTKTETTSDEVRLKHRGFADIADDVIVKGADLFNGLLKIELERVIPEEKRPRKIDINDENVKVVDHKVV